MQFIANTKVCIYCCNFQKKIGSVFKIADRINNPQESESAKRQMLETCWLVAVTENNRESSNSKIMICIEFFIIHTYRDIVLCLWKSLFCEPDQLMPMTIYGCKTSGNVANSEDIFFNSSHSHWE